MGKFQFSTVENKVAKKDFSMLIPKEAIQFFGSPYLKFKKSDDFGRFELEDEKKFIDVYMLAGVIYYYFQNNEFPNLTFEDLKFTKQEIKDYYNLPYYKELNELRTIAINKEFDNEFIDSQRNYTTDKTPIKLILSENSDLYNYENRKFGSASIQFGGKPFIREIYSF